MMFVDWEIQFIDVLKTDIILKQSLLPERFFLTQLYNVSKTNTSSLLNCNRSYIQSLTTALQNLRNLHGSTSITSIVQQSFPCQGNLSTFTGRKKSWNRLYWLWCFETVWGARDFLQKMLESAKLNLKLLWKQNGVFHSTGNENRDVARSSNEIANKISWITAPIDGVVSERTWNRENYLMDNLFYLFHKSRHWPEREK